MGVGVLVKTRQLGPPLISDSVDQWWGSRVCIPKSCAKVHNCNPSYVGGLGRRSTVQGWRWQKAWETLSGKITKAKRAGGMFRVVKCLPSSMRLWVKTSEKEFAFLSWSQVTKVLLVQRAHFGHHCLWAWFPLPSLLFKAAPYPYLLCPFSPRTPC
jgi:hypothetical protein